MNTDYFADEELEEEAAWLAQQADPLRAVCLSGSEGTPFTEQENCSNRWGGTPYDFSKARRDFPEVAPSFDSTNDCI